MISLTTFEMRVNVIHLFLASFQISLSFRCRNLFHLYIYILLTRGGAHAESEGGYTMVTCNNQLSRCHKYSLDFMKATLNKFSKIYILFEMSTIYVLVPFFLLFSIFI